MSFCFSKPSKLHAQKPLKIGFLVASIELGSNVAYAKAIYALKALYPCKLIVFGNTITTALYSQAKHIDHLIDIAINTWQITDKSPTAQKSYAPLRAKQIATISSFSCDYLILSDAKSAFLRFALATNAKKVLCARKFISLLAPRARTLPIYSKPKYKSMPFEHILLHLVRMIDTARYDEYIHSIPLLANARLHASPKVQEKIDKIFTYKNARYWGGGGLLAPCRSGHDEAILDSRFVLVNPFNHNSRFSLPESAWLDLIEELLARDYPVLLITYPSVHKTFMHTLIARGLARKIFVFANDTNPGNLIAMVGKAHYCISPSTGTIHLALNLGLKCIGLYPSYDQGRWGSEQLTYITLTTPRNELDSGACATLIAQTMETLKSLGS